MKNFASNDRGGLNHWIGWSVAAVMLATALVFVPASAGTSESVDIGMPFAGRYGIAEIGSYPSTHGPLDGNGWANDLYAIDRPVRPRFSNASGTLSLRIAGVGNTCSAGKTVTVDVSVDGVAIGRLRYGHLAQVPAFVTGQAISTDTVLGSTRQWTKSAGCWEVDNASGIHSHVTANNSCFVQHPSHAALADGSRIGTMGGAFSGTTRKVCGPSTPQTPTESNHKNFARNGGFNTGTGSWSRMSSTNFTTYPSGGASTPAYEGTRFAATNTSAAGGGIYQDIPLTIKAGDTFCAEAAVRTQGTGSPTSGRYVLWLLGGTNESSSYTYTGISTTWTPIKTCTTATTAHTKIRVQFYPNPASPTLTIDAVDVS